VGSCCPSTRTGHACAVSRSSSQIEALEECGHAAAHHSVPTHEYDAADRDLRHELDADHAADRTHGRARAEDTVQLHSVQPSWAALTASSSASLRSSSKSR